MNHTDRLTYRDAGVDIDAWNRTLEGIKGVVRSTFTSGVRSDIGHFGGLFDASFRDLHEPVLVSSSDGVGTKLKVAYRTGRHSEVSGDLVRHCVNDILVLGARPLFFLDYIGMARLDGSVVQSLVSGMADACRACGCALLGGETAEMPGVYHDGEYDLVGFIVGVVDRERILDGSRIREGDVAIGLASDGLHTNGYSLALKILFEKQGLELDARPAELGASIANALLQPHRCYLPTIQPILEAGWIRGMAHITGGGFVDNVPRVIPDGLGVRVKLGSWEIPPLFRMICSGGPVAFDEAFRVFNMGIGMVLFVGSEDAGPCIERLNAQGGRATRIGHVVAGSGVHFEGSHELWRGAI
ncbi:MAG: phosphoribosylformylglycinamidine cyclo-ligase [Planctomycetes bacterium]|nr:phosphoribosylformylglycinamidine cyclo-ligase [Planctomycetota bacterium]MBI3844665.1 phosphoribosylformylglycinamidine cyclo-ligase [Planctomycetota bacterium]